MAHAHGTVIMYGALGDPLRACDTYGLVFPNDMFVLKILGRRGDC